MGLYLRETRLLSISASWFVALLSGEVDRIVSELYKRENLSDYCRIPQTWCGLTSVSSMLSIVTQSMGSICSRHKHYHEADAEEDAQVRYG